MLLKFWAQILQSIPMDSPIPSREAGYAAVAHVADGADCAVASGTVRRLHFGELRFTRLGLAMRGKWLRKVKNLQTAGVYPSLSIFIQLSLSEPPKKLDM